MEVDKSQWKVLQQALIEWQDTGKLSKEQATELKKTIVFKQNERQQVAQYFFFIALFCTLLAFGALFLNEKLLERLKHYLSWNDIAIAAIAALLAIVWLWYTGRKRSHISPAVYEIYMVLGGLAILTSLIYTCKYLGIDQTYTAFLSIALPTLLIVSTYMRSSALWIGAIVTSVCWYSSFTVWLSANNLFLGMNYPMRYTLFGLLILGISLLQPKIKPLAFSARITYTAGLVLLFTGLWFVSIFGNFNSITAWQHVRQVHVVPYAVFFALASGLSFYLGIKYKDELARDFGILFLLINLYTRYFEYFWDAMNKGIFFIILAVTFGVLGRWLEKKKRSERKMSPIKEG